MNDFLSNRKRTTVTSRSVQQLTDTRWVYLALAVMVALSLIPIWLFDYFPSQDGPVHINSVSVLNDYQDNALYQRFYTEQWQLTANQAFFALYALLARVLPLELVQNLILSLYIIATPLAVLAALRLAGGSPYAALLVMPALYSLVLYMGFFSFCLSLGVFALVLGLYFYYVKRPSWQRAVMLAASLYGLYLLHPLAALWAMVLIALYTLTDVLKTRHWRKTWVMLACLAPTALTIIGFWLAKSIRLAKFTGSVTETSGADELALGFIKSLVSNPLTPLQKLNYLLDSLTFTPAWLTAVYYLVLGVLSFLAVRSLRRSATLAQRSAFVGAGMMVLVMLLAPERLDEFGWLPARLLPLVIISLVMALGSVSLPRRIWRVAGVAALVITSLSLFYRLPAHAGFAETIEQYRSASEVLEPNSVFLPINFDVFYNDEERQEARLRPEFLPLQHAASYLLLDKPLVNLRNYQASKPYFPLRHRLSHDPATALSPDDQLSSFHGAPLHLDLERFEARTGETLDYVLIWGTPENPNSPDIVDFFEQLAAGYELSTTIDGDETMRVYERAASE